MRITSRIRLNVRGARRGDPLAEHRIAEYRIAEYRMLPPLSDIPTGRGPSSGVLRFAVVLSLGFLLVSACRLIDKSPEHRYDIKGKVVSVDKGQRKVTIAHEDIAGYMTAMTMPFAIKDDWAFGVLQPGDSVNAELVVDGSHSWLEGIVITQESADGSESLAPGAAKEAAPGDEVPDFTLINQDGVRINLHQYRGKAVLLTFIYTRCPLPDYCPLMSNNFADIESALKKDPALYGGTHLLSITIDPRNDSPAVMRSYGLGYVPEGGTPDFGHWEMATGSPDDVKRIAEFFGLRYWEESGQIVHSLRTALVGPDGKVLKVYRGNDWKPDAVLADVKAAQPPAG